MEPLPPLAPLPDAARPDLSGHAGAPGSVSGAPQQQAGGFTESFPGQLREGVSWEGLLDLRQAPAAEDPSSAAAAPSSPASQIDTNNWPDWPSFLRHLDTQGGD
jgi:hypothetical protein